MSTYATALDAYLRQPEHKVIDFAERVGTQQPNITRYRLGQRFPSAEMARKIEQATDGEVPFSLWQNEFLSRAGVTSQDEAA